jgi:hypothetical protein
MLRGLGRLRPAAIEGRFAISPRETIQVDVDAERIREMGTGVDGLRASPQEIAAQHPRQIDRIDCSTFASSRSMAELVPSKGPFWGPLPTPLDESAVPSEFVPGTLGLVPKAPPVTGVPADV